MIKQKILAGILIMTLLPGIGGCGPGAGQSASGSGTSSAAGTAETLSAAATSMSYTVTDDSKPVRVGFHLKTAAASNRIFITVNGDSAETGYNTNIHYVSAGNIVSFISSNAATVLNSNSLANDAFASANLIVSRMYDGTNTRFTIFFQTDIDAAATSGRIYKTVSGDVALTAINIYSNQSNGIAESSYIL